MGNVRWLIFVAMVTLLSALCRFNVHQRHFNFFMLGLFSLIFLLIVVFWLMVRWLGLENTESIKEKKPLGDTD